MGPAWETIGIFVICFPRSALSRPSGSPLTSKTFKCPERSFGSEGVNVDIVFDVVNPFPSKGFPIHK